jgi:hypothetical protein
VIEGDKQEFETFISHLKDDGTKNTEISKIWKVMGKNTFANFSLNE